MIMVPVIPNGRSQAAVIKAGVIKAAADGILDGMMVRRKVATARAPVGLRGGGGGSSTSGSGGGTDVSHSAPGPELGAGLPALIFGGYLWYRRRVKQRRKLSGESKA